LVIDRLIFDMKEMFVEPRSDDPPRTDYQGVLHSFRIDPHEFSAATNFYIQNVKLAAFERADDSYTVRWTYSDAFAPGTATLALYRDADRQGFDGTQIAGGLDPASGSYLWNTSGLAGGTYYLYAVVSDGTNGNRAYARWPVVIDHSDQLALSHARLNYAKVGSAITAAQTVRISSTKSSIAWTAAATTANGVPWITLSATSGTTPTTLQIGVDPTGLAIRSTPYTGTVTISSGGAGNSPQTVAISLEVMNRSGVPWGNFDTPTNGATGISGSIAVTGWALDDIEVIAIKLYRDPQAGEPTQTNGKVYIGDANLVEGARPDVESLYPEAPWNYRAGWGYMLLTNFLPYSGNGTFRIYAYISDRDGHATLLGSKQISCDNANAVSPFGTIDTPAQGGMTSGSSYVNFGWALTPQPGTIPTDGSTIWV
ncbi:MAG TPA: hypothetical protein PKK12_14385, partial [Candidatus Aminicenantes bacterium]|nr:hypothetical protein [Candidatus Aminicenantes bacterium]